MSNARMIEIANEHGFQAEENVSGGVDVYIPYTQEIDNSIVNGFEVFKVNNLYQLKLALGY